MSLALQQLISAACKPGPDQISNIDSLGGFIKQGKISEVFVDIADTESDQHDCDLDKLAKDLSSVPDRTINILGTNQEELPDWIYPGQYCDQLLRNTALALRLVEDKEHFNIDVLVKLLQSLFTLMPGYVESSDKWWRFVVSSPRLTRAILSHLSPSSRMNSLSTILRYSKNPEILFTLFEKSLTEVDVLNLLTLRSVSWCDHDHVWCLVTYLTRAHPDTVPDFLVKIVSVWSDEVEVDQGDYKYLLILGWIICSLLGNVTRDGLDQTRDLVTRRLMAGMMFWLEADINKRQLGMSVATVMLDKLGGPVPDWNIEDRNTLEIMESLAEENRLLQEVKLEFDIDKWDLEDTMKLNTKQSPRILKKSLEKVPLVKQLDSDDSEDSDDDDLPAYDMSDDTSYDKDKKPILYIRDVLDHLADPESNQQEECLERISEFARSRLQYEDPTVVTEVINLTIFLQNKFDTKDWAPLRQSALTSVILCSPTTCAGVLSKVKTFIHYNDLASLD